MEAVDRALRGALVWGSPAVGKPGTGSRGHTSSKSKALAPRTTWLALGHRELCTLQRVNLRVWERLGRIPLKPRPSVAP